MPLSAIQRQPYLQDALDDAGIPWVGITVNDINATPPDVVIEYSPLATSQQIADGDAILAAFDWRQRRPLPLATIRSTLVQRLDTNAKRFDFLLALLGYFMRTDARAAGRITRLLGEAGIAVDEVVP